MFARKLIVIRSNLISFSQDVRNTPSLDAKTVVSLRGAAI